MTDATPPLGAHLFEILLALSAGPAHGYGIIVDIRERTGGRVVLSTSTLYRGIERLLDRGWISETTAPSDAASGGPARRYYRLTARGRAAAEREAERLRDVMAVAESRLLSPSGSEP